MLRIFIYQKENHQTGSGNNNRLMSAESTSRKCGQQEETAEHLKFDCEVLEQVRFTVFGLDIGIL